MNYGICFFSLYLLQHETFFMGGCTNRREKSLTFTPVTTMSLIWVYPSSNSVNAHGGARIAFICTPTPSVIHLYACELKLIMFIKLGQVNYSVCWEFKPLHLRTISFYRLVERDNLNLKYLICNWRCFFIIWK